VTTIKDKPLSKTLTASKTITVDDLLPQQKAWIKELPNNPLMPCLGLRPGKTVQMVTRQKFGGPLVIRMNGRSVAVSRSLARQIKLESDLTSEVMETN